MNNYVLQIVTKTVLRKITLFFLAILLTMPVQAVEKVRYIHTDMLGSPAAATDGSGEVVWRESYRPYGERILDTTDENRLWFTGKLEQPDIGLNYFGARWYDPMVGRFTGIDPIGVNVQNVHSFNRYAYANNNPYKFVDTDGRLSTFIQTFRRGLTRDEALTVGGMGNAAIMSAGASTIVAGSTAIPGPEEYIAGAVILTSLKVIRIAKGVIPDKVSDVLKQIKERNGSPPRGYKGGRKYENDGRANSQKLPKLDSQGRQVTYKEYDVNPYKKGTNRGAERIVRGSDGTSYYTPDHYRTFIKIE
ncbi:MAG: RHS domain-containing protein [Candidatus Thiodiazotropha sp. (ex Myrtea sp. 'scaly one' KF741663)]|nr:RHS domain-containing protein [Candidatus Thiodiazotropha sp. (ex Myrtea sp. 'scaly one' KF741663)]